MPQLALIALLAVAVLMFKHAVAHFYLQSTYQYVNKGHYGHPGGMLHSAIHVALTPLVYLVSAPSLLLALGIAASEFLLHYHIDWLKEQITHRNGWTRRTDASGSRSAPISWCTASPIWSLLPCSSLTRA